MMLSAEGFGIGPAAAQGPPIDTLLPITPGAQSGYVALEETFLLASNPTSNFTLYLDFDGHITADTAWNGLGAPPDGRFGLPFATPPYDIDGDDTFFNEQELFAIQEAFLRVSEDFAPFDINVTTTQPPLDDLINSGSGDTRWGVRMVIGGSAFDWFYRTEDPGTEGPVPGGIAFLGSFSDSIDTPAFAFSADGGFDNGKNLAEVISHEVGHTLGLNHDGAFLEPINIPIPDPEDPPTEPEVQEYYLGHTNGVWGPIMGAAYTPTITQWSQGEYFLANNDEDDLALITDPSNGVSFRADDHGDMIGEDQDAMMPSPFSEIDYDNDFVRIEGLIEQNTDVDFFEFTVAGGNIQIDALPAQLILPDTPDPDDPDAPPIPGGRVNVANLDIKIELYDSAGVLIASAAPDFEQTASLLYENVVAGTYYVSITGDGYQANPQDYDLLLNGYTDYGSLGRYSLTVNAELGTPPDPFEENDTRETAYVVGAADFFSDELSIHRLGDEDYFLYQPATDGTLTVNVEFLHALSDLDLEIRNEQNELLVISAGVTDGEVATLPVTAGANYYIHVYAFEGVSLDNYSLTIDGPGLLADPYEATEPFVVTDPSRIVDRNLHFAGDEDFFEWQAPITGIMTTDLFFDAAADDFLIEVADSTGAVLAESVASPGGQRSTLVVTGGEVYTVRVFSSATSPGDRRVGAYELQISSALITGDRLEPNGPDNPTLIAADVGQFYKISIDTPTDRDYFTFTAPSRGTLTIDAQFIHRFGDLDVRVTDSTGVLVALATTITDNESLVINVTAGETYLIETYGYQGAIVPLYALLTRFTAAPAMAGDFDGNGLVNRGDLSRWAEDYGLTGTGLVADANGDGVVDAADYTVWRDQANDAPTVGGDHSHSHSHAQAVTEPIDTTKFNTVAERVATSPVSPRFRVPVQSPIHPVRVKPTVAVTEASDLDSAPVFVGLGQPSQFTRGFTTVRSPLDFSLEPNDTTDRALALLLSADGFDGDDEFDMEIDRPDRDAAERDDAFAELAVAFDRVG